MYSTLQNCCLELVLSQLSLTSLSDIHFILDVSFTVDNWILHCTFVIINKFLLLVISLAKRSYLIIDNNNNI